MARIDPERIRTPEELRAQLVTLFHAGGWSVHRLSAEAKLGLATVQGILNGKTTLPHAGTLEAFVKACGQDPGPWIAARGRIVRAETSAEPGEEAPGAGRVVYLPPRAERTFVGRAGELARLDEVFSTAGRPGVVVGRRSVGTVHGLGGIGKSTLAARWARGHLDEHTVTWWIPADTAEAVQEGLAALAAALNPALAGQPLEVLTAHALTWLADHRDWLLILDDVTRRADIESVLARCRQGRVLVTSRLASGWQQLTDQVIALDVLPLPEAVELLTRTRLGTVPDGHDPDGAAELCEELGCLPLAIEQAAAFMAETGGDPRHYLRLLADYPADLYAQPPAGGDIDRTIARIWHATLDHLAAETPSTGRVLRVLAWFAPDHIPRTLLEPLAEDVGGPVALHRTIGRLAAYSMIALVGGPEDGTIGVHRLVQAVARTPDPTDPHRRPGDIATAMHQATRLLRDALPGAPEDPGTWPAWRALLPHIDALTDHAPPDADTADTRLVLTTTGLFLDGHGDYKRAIDYLKRAKTTAHRLHGRDHPDALATRHDLAVAYESAGDFQRAIRLLETTLSARNRVLGPDHPDTLRTRHQLAFAHDSAGDSQRAYLIYKDVLAARKRVLGPEHPETLQTRHEMVGFVKARNPREAIPLYLDVLAARSRVLGHDHPETLNTRNNLAHTYKRVGDLRRAVPEMEAVLSIRERVLGSDHPLTSVARNNLAGAYDLAGDSARAIEVYEATLADRRRVVGPDHPLTINSLNNLAYAYDSAGDLDRAIGLYRQALRTGQRVLGPAHPITQSIRRNLVSAEAAQRRRT
ncbi:tetratricopeptide repeat protein [Actinomadura fibrosa]|uniref:Tetratricopeptide repeat protein n=1 Tax=Actinomadura fibrosa TaxID=111802 RepID=A0ABW2XJ39_9ACTN|nr:tetratricopeptide repeat protein [Actinomadura fibrosa]